MDKKCAIPTCKNQGESRGKNASGEIRRGRFCGWHNNKNGKEERIKFQKDNPIPNASPRVKGKGPKGLSFTKARRIQKKERFEGIKKVPLEEDTNINQEKLKQFREESKYGISR